MTQSIFDTTALDDKLSQRFIDLDPAGYFIIYVDRDARLIFAEHFTNTINEKGLACDPETGDPLPCNGSLKRQPSAVFKGRTAKELCIEVFEKPNSSRYVTRLDHAAYLGREFLRAEIALLNEQDYIQD
jgi:dihydropteroate synthase